MVAPMGHDTFLGMETMDGQHTQLAGEAVYQFALTILGHPQSTRVGEVAWLSELDAVGGAIAVSRVAPGFGAPSTQSGGATAPLTSPYVSRKTLTISRDVANRLRIDPGQLAGRVRLEGQVLHKPAVVSPAEAQRGLVIRLGTHVVLLLHLEQRPTDRGPSLGLVGETSSIRHLRREVLRLADAAGAVLVRGATGTGKELVSAALHRYSERADKPYVAVNMAAVPASLAASELFGHSRGAFSGATTSRDGYFVGANGGTLFLDEVGDTPDDVQAALLRVLETGEVQSVGASSARKVDVRLVAATDADLEVAMSEGRFRKPLYYRLATHEIRIPSLLERRADIGRLIIHFLRERLAPMGRQSLLDPPMTEKYVWLSADIVERMALHSWPGNVRELRNVTTYLAGHSDEPTPLRADDPSFGRLLGGAEPRPTETPATPPSASPAPQVKPSDISDELLERVLLEVDYKLGAAAESLGISRPSLNGLIDAHPTLKRAKFLTDDEIERGREEAQRSGRPLEAVLRVSKRGLLRRIQDIDRA